MSILRPVEYHATAYGVTGAITQHFWGNNAAEHPGYIRLTGVQCGRHTTSFTGAVYRHDVHLAIDYGCPIGTAVKAVQAGKVLLTGTDSTGGVFIYLRVKSNLVNQIVAFYYHLKPGSVRVKTGDYVKQGDIIAQTGNSGGISTGPHLHFTLMRGPRIRSMAWFYANAMRFDPTPFINGRAMATIL